MTPDSKIVRVFRARIKVLEERKEKIWVSGQGDNAVFREESRGWWVIFHGWPAAMCIVEPVAGPDGVTADKPDDLEVGAVVELRMQRVSS